jgi:hypothetical protein
MESEKMKIVTPEHLMSQSEKLGHDATLKAVREPATYVTG